MIPNVLAQRYASPAMAAIWAPDHRIVAERRLWLAVLDAQADLGLDIPDGVITDYARVIDQIDLVSIARRERMTRHDVKARIEEFNWSERLWIIPAERMKGKRAHAVPLSGLSMERFQ